jgi:hypothetical protein
VSPPDAIPALVRALAAFHTNLHPGPRLFPEPPSANVQLFLKERREIVKRLTAKEMRTVWSKLARRRRVQEPYVDKHWDVWNATLQASDCTASRAEKAAALLFTTAVNVFSSPRVVETNDIDRAKWESDKTIVLIPYKETLVWTRAEVEQTAEPLRVAANQCRIAAGSHPRIRKQDEELADALLKAAEYSKTQWEFNVRFDPSIVEKSGNRDEVRTRVVALVTEMLRLYNTPLYVPTAKIASAALKDLNIGWEQVQKWWNHRSMPSGQAT